MNTKTLVQTSANVIRITNIAPGNLYKRFDFDGYDKDCTFFGVVNNVYNDGENTIIEATEYKLERYGGLSVANKNITSRQEVVLFPCTLEEFELEFDKAKADLEKKIADAEKDIANYKKQMVKIDKLISGEAQKNLTMASYKELTQAQYNEAKEALN